MTIADKIKLYLFENNISQTWLSQETKIAIPKLNASLNNKRKLSSEEFGKIIKVIGVDANTFINIDSKQFK